MAAHRKILCISHFGGMGELCKRLESEGNEVKYFIKDKGSKDIFTGLIGKVDAWEPHVAWADLVILDDSNFGDIVEELHEKGKPVIGGTCYTDKLEMDRGFGQEEMRSAGMTVLPDWSFKSLSEAIAFVKKNPARYVVKPSGTAQDEKCLTFVGKDEDGADVIETLTNYQKKWSGKIKEIQVQTFAKGVEVAVSAFFNGKEFLRPCFVNFEYKKIMNDDLGPNGGESGTSSFWDLECRLFDETLKKMEPLLARGGFHGIFDINCIATKEAIYPLEFTPRFGFPTIWLQMDGIKSKMGDLFDAVANGRKFRLETDLGYQLCVVMAVHPFPFEDKAAFAKYSKDAPVKFSDPAMGGIYMADMKLQGGALTLAGESGYAVVCVGKGMTMNEAKEAAYERVKTVSLPNAFYRTDIGCRWAKDRDLLQAWGWL